MNENSNSFGLLLGEFLDKAAIAMSEIATAAEDFINKTVENSIEFQHPADAKRIELLGNILNGDITMPPSSPSRHKSRTSSSKNKQMKDTTDKKVSKAITKEVKDEEHEKSISSEDESDESSTEMMATQAYGKAAGFTAHHYIMDEAEDADAAEEDEEEIASDNYSSTYSDV